jgi:hypothetical protein
MKGVPGGRDSGQWAVVDGDAPTPQLRGTLIQLLPWTPTCRMEAAARLIVVTCTAVGLLERGYLAEGRTGRQGLDA